MDDGRVGRQFRRRAGLAIAGDRAVDQSLIEGPQRAVIQFQSSHHAGAEVFDQDIGTTGKFADDFNTISRFQIENEALLAHVELAKSGGTVIADRWTVSHRLTFDRLDLDDLRAHVRQHPRTMRAGNGGGKVEHSKPFEAFCRISLVLSRDGHLAMFPAPWKPPPRPGPQLLQSTV